jgi:hypothetical protein
MQSHMEQLDAEYRAASGIADRRDYKIYYSHIHPFPLLVLGQNPGGETDDTDLAASATYELWEHDYLCFRFDPRFGAAGHMCRLLAAGLQTRSVDVLRQVPATNVIFRRSRDTESLKLAPRKAAAETAPFLRKILIAVNPEVILLVSKTAYEIFREFHCEEGSVEEDPASRIYTPNGRHNACIFLSARARVRALGRPVQLFMIGHPSRYAARREWQEVTDSLSKALQRSGIAPIEKKTGALVSVKPIESYGTHV